MAECRRSLRTTSFRMWSTMTSQVDSTDTMVWSMKTSLSLVPPSPKWSWILPSTMGFQRKLPSSFRSRPATLTKKICKDPCQCDWARYPHRWRRSCHACLFASGRQAWGCRERIPCLIGWHGTIVWGVAFAKPRRPLLQRQQPLSHGHQSSGWQVPELGAGFTHAPAEIYMQGLPNPNNTLGANEFDVKLRDQTETLKKRDTRLGDHLTEEVQFHQNMSKRLNSSSDLSCQTITWESYHMWKHCGKWRGCVHNMMVDTCSRSM